MDQQLWLALVTGLMGVLVLMFGAIIKRLFTKQDELEKSKANASSTDSRFHDMLSRLDDHIQRDEKMHDKLGEKIDKTNELLTTATVHIASLDGRLKGREENGNHAG